LGRSHAPIKSRQTSPAGDERHSESQSGPRADSAKQSQLAAGRRLTPTPDATRSNPNSKRKATATLVADRVSTLRTNEARTIVSVKSGGDQLPEAKWLLDSADAAAELLGHSVFGLIKDAEGVPTGAPVMDRHAVPARSAAVAGHDGARPDAPRPTPFARGAYNGRRPGCATDRLQQRPRVDFSVQGEARHQQIRAENANTSPTAEPTATSTRRTRDPQRMPELPSLILRLLLGLACERPHA
jgi:hypothetical protein